MFQKHLSYIKDNPQRYWFKRKIWGWGWTPATWQGWLSTLIYISLVLLIALNGEEEIPGNPDSGTNFLMFGLPIILLTVAFIFLAYKKGEKLKK